jgi:alpha-D-ribose 1-methylphosphonate 5-triphosphate synthase subunit PhnH
LDEFAQGSLDYPDRSTTLLVEVAELEAQAGFTFEGPGIGGRRSLRAQPLPSDFSRQWRANRSRYPRGIDLVLCCGTRFAALPRSVRIVE